jgi:streptogramin lyase
MVYEDSRGRIWVYSENQKLTMIDTDGKVKDFPYASRAMCDDADHSLWLGTLGNGLIKLNPETNETTTYTVEQGLCNNIIYGIINVDNQVVYWLRLLLMAISRFSTCRRRNLKTIFITMDFLTLNIITEP